MAHVVIKTGSRYIQPYFGTRMIMAHVIIENWFSRCSECGGNADANESRHNRGGPKSGYSSDSNLGQTNGCQVEWTHRELVYAGNESDFNLTDMSKPFRRW